MGLIKKRAISGTVALVTVGIVTAILLRFKLTGEGVHHPVFFYLLPVALIGMISSRAALLGAGVAALASAYFLYDPVYSFEIANRLEIGDLAWFTVLAAIGIKCARGLRRPSKPRAIGADFRTP